MLLILAGLAHIVYLYLSVDQATTEAKLYWGAFGFGIAYVVLGILIGRNAGLVLPVSLG